MTMEQKMHELLCAYALGEVDAAQRIEIERALAASPELRAELEKIEDTIGLVRETLGGGEAMSPEAEQALMSAVNPEPRKTQWFSNGWMRMAAGFLVVGGGAILMHQMFLSNGGAASRSGLASGEKESASNSRRLDGLGYIAKEKGLVAQLDEKNKNDFWGVKTQTDAGTAVPGEQPQPLAGSGGGGGGNTVTTTSFPESPLTLDRNALPKEEAEITTFEEDLLVDSVKAGQPPATKDSPQWRGQVAPDPASGAFGRLAAKETYRASGDSASPSTPKARDGSAPFDQSGAGGGGGKTAYKIPPAGSSRPSSPAPGPAATGTDPSTGSPAAKSREELGLASAGKREARLEDRKAEPEGKAKGDESAKKLAELQQKQVPATPADGGDDRFSFAGQGQNPVLADEPQVRLRRLLERAKNAEAERSARLAGTVPSPSAPRAGWAGLDGDDRDDEASLRELYFKLTPEQRAQLIEQECRRVFDGCRRLPDERPRDMYFRYWGDNPFEITALDPLSTFSADVDTASYALARRYLVEGKLPEKAQIRTEEFVNYFKADVAAPTKGVFAIHTDLAPSRFAQPANSTWTLRVVVRGKELAKEERKPLHLTCVIDCSGSMREQNRMETVKDTLRLLLAQLNSADMVGIVAFSTEARQILPLTSVGNRGLIEVAIQQLAPDGWTNSEAGLKLGYETALAGLDAQATNRVVFLSDGVANQGVTDPTALSETLRPIREKGVYLNTIGVGMNNHNDALLEQLADKGDGMCSYVDDMREAKHVMMDNFMGSVETIARDVKIQVDFDPAQVAKYRLLGYENRSIADADFRNDKVDAGEVGAGHQVTALYEIERNLGAASEKPLATVRLRYKAPRIVNGPANEEATEIKAEVLGSKQTSFEGSDAGYRRAVIVGQFAEFLRRSVHARGRSLDELLAEAHKLEAQLPQDAEFREFVALAERSKQLVLSNLPGCDELCQAIDAYRTWQFQCAQAERLSHERQQQIVEDLARQNRDMEEKIRELLRRRLENSPR